MFWLKSCSRCKGDLYLDNDTFGTYISCVQCSSYLTEEEQEQFLGTVKEPSFVAAIPQLAEKVAA